MVKSIYCCSGIALLSRATRHLFVRLLPGAVLLPMTQAFALEGSGASVRNPAPVVSLANARDALKVSEEASGGGKREASIAALKYAADQGEILAKWKLGQMYAKGEGVPHDDLKAYRYFNQIVDAYHEDEPNAIRAGISEAFVAVGVYSLNGIPNTEVHVDCRRAFGTFLFAATVLDDSNAQYDLAHMYMVGSGGLPTDNGAAIRWLAIAARKGHAPSEALLGHMLFQGLGVPRQRARGLMWLDVAKDGTLYPTGDWIRALYQKHFDEANDSERASAASLRAARAQPTIASSSGTLLSQPFDASPANQ
jgi:uncharacterized protein